MGRQASRPFGLSPQIKFTDSYEILNSNNLSRNDKDNTNGQTAASSSSTSVSTPAKSQSVSRQSRLSLTSKRGSLDSTSSITSFNSTYNSRRSSQPPQEFWW